MSSFITTGAATAESDYRRERATRAFRSTGGAHPHHVPRFGAWRDLRRNPRRSSDV